MEAMASARAVLAPDPDHIDEGKTGFVVRYGDHKRMGKAARAKVEQEFGLDKLVSQFFVTYLAVGWRDA
jgi:hypothetical protein